MAALTKDRNTPKRVGATYEDPAAAGAKVHAGSIVVLNATGLAVPGSTALGLKARGMAAEAVDNTGGADGDLVVKSEPGVYRFENDGSIDRTHIDGTAYIVDDQTVAATDGTGTRSAAGTIKDVDADGVWVAIGI
ncbi:MAG: hypothetical protein OEZ16_12480 [Chromatiales bacterium]|nr:hypothetical protein [Chromatiales bacterium]